MHDFPRPQELDDVVDIRVVGQTQDVVIGDPGLLLGGQILRQIGDQVALHSHRRSVPREAGGGGRINTGGVVHEVRLVSGLLDLLRRHASGQLMNDGANNLEVPELLHADVRQQSLQLRIWHGVPLTQIPQRCTEFPIRPT